MTSLIKKCASLVLSMAGARASSRGATARSFPGQRRLPLLEKREPLGLVEPHQQIVIDRDRLHRAAQLLAKGDPRILAGDVGAHRIELGLLRGDRLPALGQKII